MAVEVASLEAVLELEKRKFEQGLKAIDKGLNKTEETLDNVVEAAGKLGDDMKDALGKAGREAQNTEGNFESLFAAMRSVDPVELGIDEKKFNQALKSAERAVKKLETVMGAAATAAQKAGDKSEEAFKDADKAAGKAAEGAREFGDEAGKAGEEAGEGAKKAGASFTDLFMAMGAADLAVGALSAISGAVIGIASDVGGFVLDFQGGMNLLQAKTGATGEELKGLGAVAVDVYKNNFGESIGDAIDAVGQVNQVLSETGDQAAASAKRALTLRDVFGIDIPESLRAVRSGMESFGITSQNVFDMMTATIQEAGDPAGDLADTVNEYSIIFAQAGFSAQEFFGILEAGVREGARNFDQVADTVKEFVIRIQDGSDTTSKALDDLFQAVGQGGAFFALQEDIELTTDALEANEKALKESEGAYKAQEQVVSGLQSALSEAQRKLDELSRPNLAGFEEFDDQIFQLEQQAKRTQLALLDLAPDSDAFKNTEKQLDDINKEIDKLSIQRDLIFDEQFRAIDKAARAGTERVVSFDQAMADIGNQKGVIAGLESEFAAAQNTLAGLEGTFLSNQQISENLTATLAQMEEQIAGLPGPTQEFLDALASGAMSPRDAMGEVIQMLKGVDDQLLQNQIGVALFGTKWEDVGPKVVLALDPATAAMENFQGATDAAADAAASGLGATFQDIWRDFQTSMLPLADTINTTIMPAVMRFAEGAGPIFERFAEKLEGVIGPAIQIFSDNARTMEEVLGLTEGALDPVNVALTVLEALLNAAITGLELAAIAAYAWGEALGAIGSTIDWLQEKWMALNFSWAEPDIPEVLKPGSPTPFEMGLRGIASAISAMPSLDLAPQMAMAPAGAGGGGGVTNLNMGGQQFGPFTGADGGVNEALLALVRMLKSQLEGTGN